MRRLLCLFVLFLSGCQATSSPITTLYDYQLLTPEQRPISLKVAAQQLADADVVMVGELHGHQAIHRFQADLLAQLLSQPRPLALAMEQFSRDHQDVINSYLKNEMGEDAFIEQSNAWPGYRSDYRALVTLANNANLDLIAANAPRHIVRCIGREGADYLQRLPADERPWVAEQLTLNDDAYKARFMNNHHHEHSPTEQQFAAQTTWDDTMAESIAQYLQQHPQHSVMLTVGRFHVANNLGTVQRLQQRNPALNIVVIYPLTLSESQPEEPTWTLQVAELPPSRIEGEPLPAFSVQDAECLDANETGLTP